MNQRYDFTLDPTGKSYFIISKNQELEYAYNNLYSRSAIKWKDCSNYIAILKERYAGNGVQIGDTLNVHLDYNKGDTIFFTVSFNGGGYTSSAIRHN